MTARDRWAKRLHDVVVRLAIIRDDIDRLGETGEEIYRAAGTLGRCPDEIACYASNGIEGTLSLLRELEHRVVGYGKAPVARKAKRRRG